MKVELNINGKLNIILTSETVIERAILSEMIDSAAKGKAISLTLGNIGEEVGNEVIRGIVGVEK